MAVSAPGSSAHFRLDALPFDNSFARLPPVFYTRVRPWGLPAPYLVAASEEVARLIGLDPGELASSQFPEIFAGNRLLPGSDPLAAVYSGHQFGVWAGQLGDGRAHLLGGIKAATGAWELQLKGAGQTPYSRFADGRAVLRSSIREFLCSEAMAGLGIPTTRALCIVASDMTVQRETRETAAVVTRVAPSFVRFGSFEHWAARDRGGELKILADYVIDHFMPQLRSASRPYEALLRDVARRTGELVAQWMAVGFMHGVMNTDNMSILGLTLDYGPFGFMEAFDAGHICNHSDRNGRYAYAAQPHVAQWNLLALAHALAPLAPLAGPQDAADAVDEAFSEAYNQAFLQKLRAKLGLRTELPGDEDFINRTFDLLQRQGPDYTLFFRQLSGLAATPREAAGVAEDALLRDLFVDREACDAWIVAWRERLAREESKDTERQNAMLAANPKYILRNWMAESAIRRAKEKDFSEVAAVLDCLRRPFDEQPQYGRFAALPPDWARELAVSCSS